MAASRVRPAPSPLARSPGHRRLPRGADSPVALAGGGDDRRAGDRRGAELTAQLRGPAGMRRRCAGCRGPEAVARHSSHPARPSLPWIRRGATPGSRPEGRGGALNADPRASWRRRGDLAGRIPSNASCRFALIDSYQDPAVSTDVATAAASRRLLSARTPGPPPYRSHRGTAGAARRRQRTRRLGRRRCGWRWPLPQRRRTSPEHGNAGERGQVTCR